jgi:hypothetical protein
MEYRNPFSAEPASSALFNDISDLSELDQQQDHCAVPLEDLARRIHNGLQQSRRDRCNALRSDLDVGDDLNEAQSGVPSGKWKWWLKEKRFQIKENRFLSVRTAQLYQQLARHRDEIEAEIERVGELSLRAARKLITKKPPEDEDASAATPSGSAETAAEPEAVDLVAAVLADLRALTDAQVTAVWLAYGLGPFLRTIPAEWRAELARRIDGLRSHTKDREPSLLRESEILRQALGQIRIAAKPETAPENAKRAEGQALTALRALANALAAVDIDRTTLVDRYAKEKRCAK